MQKYIIGLMLLLSLGFAYKATENSPKEEETLVLITTDYGDIKIKLYNDTPKHRDNFIKLVNEKKYDGSIFHRIIPQFMIQGGGGPDGTKDLGTPIAAEIKQNHIHLKGVLAAARMGDDVNPLRNSSGSQFYIVHGRPFAPADIEMIGKKIGFAYTPEQIAAYAKQGGAPHLDGAYTVFGEVVSGMDIVDKIAVVERNKMDRPLQDIKMTMKVVK